MDALMSFFNPTNLISIGVVMLILLGMGYIMRKSMREENLTLTQYFNRKIVGEHMGIVLLFIFISALAEAIIASTIPHPNEYMNPIARFLTHLSMNLVGVILLISVPQTMVDLLKTLSKKNKTSTDKAVAFMMFIKATIMIVAAYAIPYINLKIIFQGLHQLHLLKMAIGELNPFVDMSVVYQQLHLPINYKPTEHMTNQAYSSLVLVFIHYLLTGVDGTHAVIEGLRKDGNIKRVPVSSGYARKPEKKKHKKKHKKHKKNKLSATDSEEVISKLIDFVNPNLNEETKGEILDEILTGILDTEQKHLNNISVQLRNYKTAVDNSDSLSESQKDELREKVRVFFRKPHVRGGLNRDIPVFSRRRTV